MNVVRLMAGLLVLGLVAGVRAEEKADVTKDKLVGTWEVVKSEEGGPPKGGVIEFAKDGKVKLTHKQDGKEETAAGTFALDGNKLTVTMKHDGKDETHKVTIKKLTDTDMTVETDKGKTAELKKKK
jgi:uncharacterized protein (TIGR03066 family)